MTDTLPQDVGQEKIHSVTVRVPNNHRLLQLKRTLDWEALTGVATQHLRMAGFNVDGVLRGRRLNVAPYVPMLVLSFVMRLNLRETEAYMAENAVGRLFVGVDNCAAIQVRDHSTIGRIRAGLGAAGLDALNALVVRQAASLGFANPEVLSADTTAQELSIGYPHEAGILRGMAARCLRAAERLRCHGKRKLGKVYDAATGLIANAKEYHLFAKTTERKTELIEAMVRQTRRMLKASRDVAGRLASSSSQGTRRATSVLRAMAEVGDKLLPQIDYWLRTGNVAKDKILHAGLPMARSIVRNKAGKKVEFGIQQLIMSIGGGYLLGRSILIRMGESKMPLLALQTYREVFGATATPTLAVYDRGGWSQENVRQLQNEGVQKVGILPNGRARWRVHGRDRERVMTERATTEGKIGTLKTSYGFNKPRERRGDTVLAVAPRSILAFNLNKLIRDICAANEKKAA